jgi:hemerythrin-like domain-containing protein
MANRVDKAVSTVKGGAKQMGQAVRGRFGIYSTLSKEHGQVSGLMTRLASTDSDEADRREELFAEIQDELTAHSEIEDAVFYAELSRHAQVKEKIGHARTEHEEIKTLLEELSTMDISHQSWMNKFLKLKETVQHHVDEEESEIFPLAEEVLSRKDAERLDEEFLARRGRS